MRRKHMIVLRTIQGHYYSEYFRMVADVKLAKIFQTKKEADIKRKELQNPKLWLVEEIAQ